MKRVERLIGAVLAFVVTAGIVSAFSFVSQPINSTVPVVGPSGNLQVSGSWPSSYTINGTQVSSFSIKDASTTNIRFSMNLTVSEPNINLTTQTILLGGVSANQGCGVGICWYTSANSFFLEPGQSMQFDVSISFHKIGTFSLSLRAVGSGG